MNAMWLSYGIILLSSWIWFTRSLNTNILRFSDMHSRICSITNSLRFLILIKQLMILIKSGYLCPFTDLLDIMSLNLGSNWIYFTLNFNYPTLIPTFRMIGYPLKYLITFVNPSFRSYVALKFIMYRNYVFITALTNTLAAIQWPSSIISVPN